MKQHAPHETDIGMEQARTSTSGLCNADEGNRNFNRIRLVRTQYRFRLHEFASSSTPVKQSLRLHEFVSRHRIEYHLRAGLRKSSVNGKLGFRSSRGTFIAPGVWPKRKKRPSRRASAS